MVDDAEIGSAKIALLHEEYLLTYLRDDLPGIGYRGYWDLPGGLREDGESLEDCVVRETEEEFGITINPDHIVWSGIYPGLFARPSWDIFYIAPIGRELIADIEFGDEGQEWKMMSVMEFLQHPKAVPEYQDRLSDYWLKRIN